MAGKWIAVRTQVVVCIFLPLIFLPDLSSADSLLTLIGHGNAG